jgi:hypothetical protein
MWLADRSDISASSRRQLLTGSAAAPGRAPATIVGSSGPGVKQLSARSPQRGGGVSGQRLAVAKARDPGTEGGQPAQRGGAVAPPAMAAAAPMWSWRD